MSISESSVAHPPACEKKAWQHELFDHLAATKFRNSNGLMSVPQYRKKIQTQTVHDKSEKLNVNLKQEPRVVHSGHQRHDSLIVGDLRSAVKLPAGTELNEWLALNVVDFYNQINLLYGALVSACSPEQCMDDTTGSKYMLIHNKTSDSGMMQEVCPGAFVKCSLDWIHGLFENEGVFPLDEDLPFPATFHLTVMSVCSRMLKIYGHFFNAHMNTATELGIEHHMFTMFRHFYYFVTEYTLVHQTDFVPMKEVIERVLDDGLVQSL